jgi:hypothetical protein
MYVCKNVLGMLPALTLAWMLQMYGSNKEDAERHFKCHTQARGSQFKHWLIN